MDLHSPQIKNVSFKKIIPSGIGSDPYVDWPIMLVVAMIIIGAFIATGYDAYVGVGDQLSAGASTASARVDAGFNVANLNKLTAARVQADAAHDTALKGYSGPADPSR